MIDEAVKGKMRIGGTLMTSKLWERQKNKKIGDKHWRHLTDGAMRYIGHKCAASKRVRTTTHTQLTQNRRA